MLLRPKYTLLHFDTCISEQLVSSVFFVMQCVLIHAPNVILSRTLRKGKEHEKSPPTLLLGNRFLVLFLIFFFNLEKVLPSPKQRPWQFGTGIDLLFSVGESIGNIYLPTAKLFL